MLIELVTKFNPAAAHALLDDHGNKIFLLSCKTADLAAVEGMYFSDAVNVRALNSLKQSGADLAIEAKQPAVVVALLTELETREVALPEGKACHVYLCHARATGGEQCALLARMDIGLTVWFDKWLPECDQAAMRSGILQTKVFFVFVPKGLMAREYPQHEMRWATESALQTRRRMGPCTRRRMTGELHTAGAGCSADAAEPAAGAADRNNHDGAQPVSAKTLINSLCKKRSSR